MSRTALLLAIVVVFAPLATPARATAPAKGPPLVQLAAADDECTTSKTIFLTVDPSGGRALECEGRPYNGPLSAVQYDAVVGLATLLAQDGGLDGRDRKRVQAYARAAARGENAAEFDADAAEAEVGALVRHLLGNVVVGGNGSLTLVSDPTDARSSITVVREFTALLEDGRERRSAVAALVRAPTSDAAGPIGISSMQVRLDAPPTRAVATITVYNFREDLSIPACTADNLDTVCRVEVVFSDGAWKLSTRGFDDLFAAPSVDGDPSTTTTTVS
jgi:hypothetical protein